MTKKLKIFLIIFISTVLKIGGVFFVWTINNNKEEIIKQPISEEIKIKEVEPTLKKVIEKEVKEELLLNARAAISVLVTPEKEYKVLFKKNSNQELPIASLTKLMTAYVVLQYYDLSHIIEISKQATLQPGEAGNLKVGQILSVKDLLFPLLIPSSNDAAYALAENISKEKFIFLMNLEAERLGLKNTYFVNSTGLDEKGTNNYSTINDLVKFIKHLLNLDKNKGGELLWDILSAKEINLYGEILVNTNQLLGRVPGIVGGRTGWTSKAGGTLILVLKTPETQANEVSEAWKGSTKCSSPGYLINIILGTSRPEARFEEMKRLIDWTKSQKTVNNKQ